MCLCLKVKYLLFVKQLNDRINVTIAFCPTEKKTGKYKIISFAFSLNSQASYCLVHFEDEKKNIEIV